MHTNKSILYSLGGGVRWERASGDVFPYNLARNDKKMQFFIGNDCDANVFNGPLSGPLHRFQVALSLSTNHWHLLVVEPFAAINDLRSRRAVLATVLGPGSSRLLDVAVQDCGRSFEAPLTGPHVHPAKPHNCQD